MRAADRIALQIWVAERCCEKTSARQSQAEAVHKQHARQPGAGRISTSPECGTWRRGPLNHGTCNHVAWVTLQRWPEKLSETTWPVLARQQNFATQAALRDTRSGWMCCRNHPNTGFPACPRGLRAAPDCRQEGLHCCPTLRMLRVRATITGLPRQQRLLAHVARNHGRRSARCGSHPHWLRRSLRNEQLVFGPAHRRRMLDRLVCWSAVAVAGSTQKIKV